MFGLVLSPMSSISRGIDKIESMKDRDCTIIDEYIKTVNIRYKSYKLKKYMKGFLRALLVISGFAITTMTTYNNPYFDGKSDDGNIIVWYFSISNNIINLILEKVSAFDMEDEKNKIKLLIDEGLLYNENKDNYALYPDTHDMKQNKLEYFKNTCEMIYDTDSYSFLTRDYDRPPHVKEINDRKLEKTELLWRNPTPEEKKRNVQQPDLPNSVPNNEIEEIESAIENQETEPASEPNNQPWR